jgi:hypothetical protein
MGYDQTRLTSFDLYPAFERSRLIGRLKELNETKMCSSQSLVAQQRALAVSCTLNSLTTSFAAYHLAEL